MKTILRLICIILCLSTLTLTACTANNSSEDYTQVNNVNLNEPEIHTHMFSSWSVTKKATCTEEGLQERICSCGMKETETIAKSEHKEILNDKAPTAITPGKANVVSCSECNVVLNEGTTLTSLKNFVLDNTTLIQNGAYHYSVFANELIPSLSGLFQIAYSDSTVSVCYLEYIGTSGSVYNFISIDLYDKKTSLINYGFSYNLTMGNKTYYDMMRGTFEGAKLYEVNEFIYQKTSSTIGGGSAAQSERFNEYQTTSARMAKNTIDLLSVLLEKENFGYGVEVFGFTPAA